MVKVSIIVPIYNVMKYLHRCLDSLVNQTLNEIEVILVNDASPDDSHKIMEEYRSNYPEKIKCIYLEENISQGGARNRGIEIAKGEYLMFVDSDDWIELTMCEKLYAIALQGNYDIVGCDYYQYQDESGNKSWNSLCFKQQTGELDHNKKTSLVFTYAYAFAKLIRRSLVISNQLFFTPHMKYEDCALTPLFYLYAKTMGYVEEPLYYYNIRENSTTHLPDICKHRDVIKAAEIFRQEISARGLEEYSVEAEALYIKLAHYLFKKASNCMKELTLDELNYFEELFHKLYPNCSCHKYYYSVTDDDGRKMAKRLADMLGYHEIHSYQYLDTGYQHYYRYYDEKINTFFDYCNKNMLRIALWGAGIKGNDFLTSFIDKKDQITCVIDKNPIKQGKKTITGHTILDIQRASRLADMIVIMNKNYYADSLRSIKDLKMGIKAFNLELFLLMEDNRVERFIN